MCERETLMCCLMYPCSHWLLPIRAPTRGPITTLAYGEDTPTNGLGLEFLFAHMNSCLLWSHSLGEAGIWLLLSLASENLMLHELKAISEYSWYPLFRSLLGLFPFFFIGCQFLLAALIPQC